MLGGKVIVYARVSTDEQAVKGYSIEAQIENGIEKARELGYSEEQVVILKEQSSGATLDRPSLSYLRESIANGDKPKIIIVYDPDRLSRQLTQQLILTDEWIKSGIQLEFVNFEWKQTPEGMMFYQLRGMFAQYEREKIRERTIRGRLTKIKKHGKLSVDPRLFGYRFDTKDDILKVNGKESAIVKQIFQLAAKGKSGEAIARTLTAENIQAPRGEKWYGSTVTRIIRNRSYLGTFMAYKTDYHQGVKRKRNEDEQFPIPIPQLIEQPQFDLANKTIDKFRTNTGRPSTRPYLLKGIGQCQCGASMVATVKSGNREYTYYKCSSKSKTCSGYWNSKIVDTEIWKKVKLELCNIQLFNKESFLSPLVETGWRQEKAELLKKKEKNIRKLENLLELFINEEIEKELFQHSKENLEKERDKIEKMLHNLDVLNEEVVEDNFFTSDDVLKILDEISIEKKNELMQMLVEKVSFHKDYQLLIEFKLSDRYYGR
ncbi:recombinase family protein [Bacillus sp. FJAT-45350]|uniref:recombinase family protein n=1 Tax=Bacillus sp. FJAT-45350 TaxID=2011014 RepID=UPI000BB7E5F9|nr:recombinase family protein [Bacillus sp. FJAT-45350]